MEVITLTESKRLKELEAVIAAGQDAWLQVGLALTEIKDSKLYRSEFETFKDYCRETWGWSDKRAYQLIYAAEESSTTGRTFGSEREARESRQQRKAAAKPKLPAKVPADEASALLPGEAEPPRVQSDPDEIARSLGHPNAESALATLAGEEKPKSKLPWMLFELLDLAKEDIAVIIAPEFDISDGDVLHAVAKNVRKAANELDRYVKSVCEQR